MVNSNHAEGAELRDTARSYDAYSKNILDVEALSESARKRTAEGRAKRPNSMRNLIFMNFLEIAKIMYCRGDDLFDIQAPISDAIRSSIPVKGGDIVKAVYVDVLDFASLAVLLKMPESTFRGLKEIVDYCDERDQVLDHLISHGTQYQAHENGQAALRMYNNLNRAIECCDQRGENCEKILLDYLNNEWHQGELEGPNLRNRDNLDFPYQGVFCFPVAAMAYIHNVDDSELRKSDYYPTDIADYVRGQ